VRHAGDIIDREQRTGKQILQVRLDLMPNNATDLFFVLSAYNSRDLSKFDGLKAVVYDSDTRRELCTCNIEDPGPNEAVLMCSVYRLPDFLWRVRMVGQPCRGTARDYKPILARLLDLGYPRNRSMRLQVNPLMESIREQFMLDMPVKPTIVTMSLGSAMKLSYAIELFGTIDKSALANGEDIVQEISKPRFQEIMVEALQAAGGQRFGYDHVVVGPARWKKIHSLRYEMWWRYPSPEPSKKLVGKDVYPMQEENFLDATCMVFQQQALRDVVDYRGPHGVRIVHNGVLDYSGVWVGKVGIGDATGGAVWHAGEVMDNAKRIGRHMLEVNLDKMPKLTTDMYCTLSAPTNGDIAKYQDLHVRILDSENQGHELTAVELGQTMDVEAVVTSCMSRDTSSAGCWCVSSVGCSTQGSARDYRPILNCLRAIQEKGYERPPAWPHQLPILNNPEPVERMTPGPPRLGGPTKLARYKTNSPVKPYENSEPFFASDDGEGDEEGSPPVSPVSNARMPTAKVR